MKLGKVARLGRCICPAKTTLQAMGPWYGPLAWNPHVTAIFHIRTTGPSFKPQLRRTTRWGPRLLDTLDRWKALRESEAKRKPKDRAQSLRKSAWPYPRRSKVIQKYMDLLQKRQFEKKRPRTPGWQPKSTEAAEVRDRVAIGFPILTIGAFAINRDFLSTSLRKALDKLRFNLGRPRTTLMQERHVETQVLMSCSMSGHHTALSNSL